MAESPVSSAWSMAAASQDAAAHVRWPPSETVALASASLVQCVLAHHAAACLDALYCAMVGLGLFLALSMGITLTAGFLLTLAADRQSADAFPAIDYDAEQFTDGPRAFASSCPICLEAFEAAKPICRGPCPAERRHVFHRECLRRWLKDRTSCPLCRHDVEPGDAYVKEFGLMVLDAIGPSLQ